MKSSKYTLVRHSGWGYGKDYRFKMAVELTSVDTHALHAKVLMKRPYLRRLRRED